MTILTDSDLPFEVPVAMTLGFFDGLHRGHTALLDKLMAQPEPSLVYTFDRKPNVPKPLFSSSERAAIAACAGIDYYYAASFDAQMKDTSPRTFLRNLMREFNAKTIVVGSDFRFGQGASGDPELLKELAPKYDYQVIVVKVRGEGEDKYSSSDLRSFIRHGELQEATELMGRYYFVDGNVLHGSRLGQKLGFPTANITTGKMLPKHGVYATLTRTPEGLFKSVTNVGIRPTIDDGNAENIETYLLDYDSDLYGKPIRVYFLELLRPEIHFANVDELREQLSKDADVARRVLSDESVYTKSQLC